MKTNYLDSLSDPEFGKVHDIDPDWKRSKISSPAVSGSLNAGFNKA